MWIKLITCLLSFALHAAFAAYFLVVPGGQSLHEGSGDDLFVVEQGIAIAAIARLGKSQIAAASFEAEPTELSEARPEIEEIKAQEEVEETEVISSMEGPVQEELPEVKPEPIEQPRPEQVATLEQTEPVAVQERQSSGEAQFGGSTADKRAYLGKLQSQLEGKKVQPHSPLKGTVVVRFTLDPSGAIVSREVAESSGSKVLDDAALASIDRAAPFPPMPESISDATMVVSVPFKFSVR